MTYYTFHIQITCVLTKQSSTKDSLKDCHSFSRELTQVLGITKILNVFVVISKQEKDVICPTLHSF
jgi:hypothetical protein